MKIFIHSFSKEKLAYKIYGFDGGKRKILRKGRFTGNFSTDISVSGKELIVRIARRNFFVAFWAALYVGIANFGNLLIYKPRMIGVGLSKYLSLYPFEELRVTDIGRSEVMEIVYHSPPLYRRVNFREKTVVSEYLTCNTHPYVEEFSGRKAVNRALYALAILFGLAVIELICHLIVVLIMKG